MKMGMMLLLRSRSLQDLSDEMKGGREEHTESGHRGEERSRLKIDVGVIDELLNGADNELMTEIFTNGCADRGI